MRSFRQIFANSYTFAGGAVPREYFAPRTVFHVFHPVGFALMDAPERNPA